jgi:hypothetical protein
MIDLGIAPRKAYMWRSLPRWRSERSLLSRSCAQDGSVHIWLDPGVLANLKALRGPG